MCEYKSKHKLGTHKLEAEKEHEEEVKELLKKKPINPKVKDVSLWTIHGTKK